MGVTSTVPFCRHRTKYLCAFYLPFASFCSLIFLSWLSVAVAVHPGLLVAGQLHVPVRVHLCTLEWEGAIFHKVPKKESSSLKYGMSYYTSIPPKVNIHSISVATDEQNTGGIVRRND